MATAIVRLPNEEYDLYKEIAREKGESVAEFFRKAARRASGIKKPTKKYSIWDLRTKIVFKGGPKDGSINHDKYYYEFEEKKRFGK